MDTRISIKSAALYWPYRWRDDKENNRILGQQKRFLIVRHAGKQPYKYRYFLDWIELEFPEIRALMELRLLPCQVESWASYSLHIPWIQDPVEDWAPGAYDVLCRMDDECSRRGIPVINQVRRLSSCVKSAGGDIMRGVGLRTPRVAHIDTPSEFMRTLGGLELPLLIREDRGHGRPSMLIEERKQLDKVPWARYSHPIAVEFIDVRDRHDGWYRKYRYLAAGSTGVTRHLMTCDHWEARPSGRVVTEATRSQELGYLNSLDPHRELFERARAALGLDLVAFDYSYDRQGELVVWEANPYPDLSYPTNPEVEYTFPYVRRSFAAVLRLYVRKAGMDVPAKLDDLLAEQDFATDDHACPLTPYVVRRAA